MTPREAVAAYCRLSPAQQLRVLSHYAHQITVLARGTYLLDSEHVADARRLRLLNDVQHRVTGQIHQLITSDLSRYSDEVLVRDAIAEDDAELLKTFEASLQRHP